MNFTLPQDDGYETIIDTLVIEEDSTAMKLLDLVTGYLTKEELNKLADYIKEVNNV